MDNEYANFGLPTDPANQPVQPLRPRGWLGRHWWWLVPASLLLLVLSCGFWGGIFVWLVGSLKSSTPYQMALDRVRSDPQVVEKLGQPIEDTSWMPTGNFSYRTINGVASGEANFYFSVSGPKGTAHVHAEARCRDGKWSFRVLTVTPEGEKTMSLPVDEKPGKVKEEQNP